MWFVPSVLQDAGMKAWTMKHITRNSDEGTGSNEKTDLHAENVTKHKAAKNPITVSGKTSMDNF